MDLRGEVDPDEDDRYSSNFCWSNSYSTSSSTGIEIRGYDATISAARSVAPTVVARLFAGKIVFFDSIDYFVNSLSVTKIRSFYKIRL